MYLYYMVTQNMLRTHNHSRSNRMPLTDHITEIIEFTPYLRTYFIVTIYYKYHDYERTFPAQKILKRMSKYFEVIFLLFKTMP